MKLPKNKKSKWIIGWIIILLVCTMVGLGIQKNRHEYQMNYNFFIEQLKQGKVEKVTLTNGSMIQLKLKGDEKAYYTDNPRKVDFKEQLLTQGVEVQESAQNLSGLQYLISTSLMIAMFIMIFRSVKKAGLNRSGQMSINHEMVEADKLTVDFQKIAGNVEAKEQVKDVIDFIKTPEKYKKLGAKMPKGIMMYGPPGTGKTLMAKAIAKEAGVPFFSVSGSDFVQLYVGVGASRVRELFKAARKYEKAVIFIDEIDAIGKKRGQGAFQGNDEKDQTLNALLTEMSGFKDDEGIIVVAATNRLDVLDEALLRPGRFDRHIEIGYPDINAREEIIRLYLKDKPVDGEVDPKELARQTVYFTGAMLANLINESAIEAANKGEECIKMAHIETAFYTVIAGKEKKDRSQIATLDRQITAYHEAGHTLVTKILAPENSVSKVTIIPSTKGAGGFSMNIPKDKFYLSKHEMVNNIKISLAGRGAEELIFGKEYITTGASNDIEKATSDLKNLQLKYGMDQEIGMINLAVLTGKEDYQDAGWIEKSCQEMSRLYEETKAVLKENEETLRKIAEALLEKETLNEKEIASFF